MNTTTTTMDNSNKKEKLGLEIGFIGFGTIASAIATGIAEQTKIPIARITVSRRSTSKSQALQEQYGPHMVTISDNTQEIIDQSPHVVFLCLLPEQVPQVLQGTSFQHNPTTTLVSVVASTDLDDLVQLTGLPAHRVAKMICTPSIAQHDGVCLLLHHPHPHKNNNNGKENTNTKTNSSSNTVQGLLPQLLHAIGGCVECTSTEQMNVLMSSTCVMGPVYGLLQTHIEWLTSKGIDEQDATFLVTRQYTAILRDATTTKEEQRIKSRDGKNRVEQLIQEQTKNGINEQALDNWKRSGSLESYVNVLDAIVSRLENKSDGSIPTTAT